MAINIPEFRSEEEESAFWDDPKNVEKYFAGADEVKVDFSPARRGRSILARAPGETAR